MGTSSDRMKSLRPSNAAVLIVATVLSLALVELTARLLVEPSDVSAGRLLGVELPPLEAFAKSPTAWDTSGERAERLVDDGPLTYGDLYGIQREDSLLGYTALEGTRSRNGWWESNEIGARARVSSAHAERGRLLVFGESFAQGSRVKQEDAWASVLDSLCAEYEVMNFGVDGYSMGQAYLRYRVVASRIEHEAVLLMFTPSVDLWRDLNSLRALRGWIGVPLVPRFVLDGEGLRVAERPYPNLATALEANQGAISPPLHAYLLRYDRFYCVPLYKVPPVVGDFMLYKIAAAGWCRIRLIRLKSELLEPKGEAVRLVQEIFAAARREAEENGARFVLAILPAPNDLSTRVASKAYAKQLDELGQLFCSETPCIDLTEDLSSLPPGQLDFGADGTHYGPLANRRIAESIAARFGCHQAIGGRPAHEPVEE